MSPGWIDAPGSTLPTRSEALDFTVSGPAGVAPTTRVAWIDTPSSLLPTRNEPLDFVVGTLEVPGPLTPQQHLDQTIWTELYNVSFSEHPALFAGDAIATYYDFGAKDVTIDGKTWRFRTPNTGYFTSVYHTGTAGFITTINGTKWFAGNYAGPYMWIDPEAAFGWDRDKPLLIIARVKPYGWPGTLQSVGVSTFARNGDDVAPGSAISSVWTSDGNEPYNWWGDEIANGPHVDVCTQVASAPVQHGPKVNPPTINVALMQWCIGVCRMNATEGYSVMGPRETGVHHAGTALELPPSSLSGFQAFNKVTAPEARGDVGMAFVSGLDGAMPYGAYGSVSAVYISLRVFQGNA